MTKSCYTYLSFAIVLIALVAVDAGPSRATENEAFLCLQEDAETVRGKPRVNVQMKMPPDGLEYTNDVAIRVTAEAQVNRLIKSEQAVTCTELAGQCSRDGCKLELPGDTRQQVASQKLYSEGCKSVVAILVSRKHNDHWHIVPTATGFFIAPGVIATNRHVFKENDEFMFAMTADTKVHPITEVLAANNDSDAALCRIEAENYTSLALRTDIPVGAPVRVISHPKGRYYSLSQGLVSRKYLRGPAPPKQTDEDESGNDRMTFTKWITITADFAVGSSGAPVFDRFGNVIGVSTSTQIVKVGEEQQDQLSQMVFRDCVPAEIVQALAK